MPWVGATEPVPHRPCRVLVAGTSGAGKTTLARRIAPVIGAPHVELDALFHGPGWVPRATFLDDVRRFSTTSRWVTEWQYASARPLLAERADLVVWLDLPRAVVMRQVIGRSVVRSLRREVLWNDNVEPPLRSVLTDRDHVVRWAWSTYGRTARHVAAALEERPGLVVVRLRRHREARAWLEGPLRAAVARGDAA
jgi:adenylate kinase family enzyme